MLGVNTPALPASLRRTNQRTVISLLLRLGRASRAELAKAAGISQPTAGKITAELLELGILHEMGAAASEAVRNGRRHSPRLGRPGQLLELERRTPRFLAIELGVTETCIACLPVSVKLEDEWTSSFPTPQSPEAWVQELKRVSADLPRHGLWGVLVSVPGIVDEDKGRVLFSPNLHWLEKTYLPDLVHQVYDLPATLVQEIRALALGQHTADPAGEDFFLVDFGPGVGGAIVLAGKLYEHPMPLSGEFGHSPVAGNPRICGCGATGCLETLVSERGLLDTFAAAHRLTAPHWPDLVRHVSARGLEPWLEDALAAASKVIAGSLNVLGVRRVVVTGRLTELPVAIEYLSREISRGALWARFGEVTCHSAPHRRAAGLVAVGLDRLILPADEEPGVFIAPTSKRSKTKRTAQAAA